MVPRRPELVVHRRLRSRWHTQLSLAVSFVVLAAAFCGGAIAGSTNEREDPGALIVSRVGSPRVSSLELLGGTAYVAGRTSDVDADAARTLWYQTVAGAAYAQRVGALRLSRKALNESGAVVTETDDAVQTSILGRDAFAVTVSRADLESGVRARAARVGATVRAIDYIPLFGGIAEIVLQPDREKEFLATSGQRIASVLGVLGRSQRPYLVTVVNSRLEPRLVLGFTPGVGGTAGQGIGWQASDVRSNSIHAIATTPSGS